MQAQAGAWDGWVSDVKAAQFVNDPFMNNTCRIAAGKLGELLAKQRPDWDFSTDSEARLTTGGKRALWMLISDQLRSLNLSSCNIGEPYDDADVGLAQLLTLGTSLRSLKLGDNLLGKLEWKRQQITRALSSNETLTELDLSNNALMEKGIKYVCTSLLTCKALVRLDLSFNKPGT